MKKKTLTLFLAATLPVALLGGCAATPYQPASASAMADGYSDMMVGNNVYQVNFKGNNLTSRATVDNYLLYRAAQLAQQKGFAGFTLMNATTDDTDMVNVTPAIGRGIYPGFSPYYTLYGPFGAYDWNPWTTANWDNSVDVTSVNNYDAHATVRLTNSAGGKTYFNAADVMSRLSSSVKMPG